MITHVRKPVVVACFKVLFYNLSGGTEENKEMSLSRHIPETPE